MKVIKNIIEYLIAISVIPAIVLTVVSVTELKDVRNVQFELLSEEDGIFNVTPGTFDKLRENRRIKKYELESNYPLITHEDMEMATWKVDDNLKNEIYIDENGQKRIRINVGKITFDGSEAWEFYQGDQTPKHDVATFYRQVPDIRLYSDYNNVASNYFPFEYGVWYQNIVGISSNPTMPYIYINILKSELENYSDELSDSEKVNLFKKWLQDRAKEGNPLTVYYELVVKNPNTMIIESRDIYITSDYVRIVKPNDFSNNPEGLYIRGLRDYIDRFEVTANWIYVYPKDISVTQLGNYLVGRTLTYELPLPRLAEVYDFSKFRLVFDKRRIRVVFDIDDEYYLWEITKDDKMIPINGRHDLGTVWNVKFYVYEIQQPIIRTLVLLIPLIVISGVLIYMYNTFKKKDLL